MFYHFDLFTMLEYYRNSYLSNFAVILCIIFCFKDHVVKQHIGVKNFSCDECGKEFYGKNNLRMHMRIHVAPENRPHGCDTCGLR